MPNTVNGKVRRRSWRLARPVGTERARVMIGELASLKWEQANSDVATVRIYRARLVCYA
jgi:hypothetical protein